MYASAVRLSPKGVLIRRDSAQTAVRGRRLVDPTCPHSQDKFPHCISQITLVVVQGWSVSVTGSRDDQSFTDKSPSPFKLSPCQSSWKVVGSLSFDVSRISIILTLTTLHDWTKRKTRTHRNASRYHRRKDSSLDRQPHSKRIGCHYYCGIAYLQVSTPGLCPDGSPGWSTLLRGSGLISLEAVQVIW